MAKLHIILILICSIIMLKGNCKSLFQHSKTTTPTFRVYLHEILSGPNATLYEVGRASISSTSPTNFGIVRVADDFITAGPGPNSQNLGRNQGHVINSGLNEVAITVEFNFLFTAGEFRGSSLTVVGRKLLLGVNQEIPIVGGTGLFRLARGYTVSNLYSFDPATNTYVYIYDFYVVRLGI